MSPKPRTGRCALCIQDKGEAAPLLPYSELHESEDHLLHCHYHLKQYEELTN